MVDQTILVQKNQNGKVKFIHVKLDANKISRIWGQIKGKSQYTSNTYTSTNTGKTNELNPAETAKADYDRIIEKKIKEGYIETNSLEDLPDFGTPEIIDLDNIPKEFCCSKPIKEITTVDLDNLIGLGKAKLFIKYNGICHYILVDSQKNIKIFTRRWDDHTRKYPSIVEAIKKRNLPPGTLFIVELVIDPDMLLPHMQAFKLMSSISKVDTVKGEVKKSVSETIKRQKEYKVRAAVFGILYYSQDKTWNYDYSKILMALNKLIPPIESGNVLFLPEEYKAKDAKSAEEFVKNNKDKIEGLIVWDLTKAMEVTMNGKPNRRAAYKLKTQGEMDVVAVGYTEGTGKLQKKIGALTIGKYNASGIIKVLGSVGSGLKPEEGDCDIKNWSFPCVVAIKYSQIFPDTGAFQFPVFIKQHEDKSVDDVESIEQHLANLNK